MGTDNKLDHIFNVIGIKGELHRIGGDKSEKLQFIPAPVKVIEHVCPKYACRTYLRAGISNTVKQAPVPHIVIPKGYAKKT